MATEHQLRSLKEEATCSICLEYFTEPVSAECGHAFCLSCISAYWKVLQTDFKCPECRGTSPNKTLLPNKRLANMAGQIKQLQTQEAILCKKHEEKLNLFCDDDQEPICVICRESKDHKTHSARPIDEAAQEYKGKLQICLATLQNSLENIEVLHCKDKRRITELEEAVKNNEIKILSTFEEKKMEQKKQLELSSMKIKHEESLQMVLRSISELENQKPTLMDLISNIEEKCQQQDVELLKGIKSIFHRFDNINHWKSKENSAGTQPSLQKFCLPAPCLLDKIKQVKISPARYLWSNYGHVLLDILAILIAVILGFFAIKHLELERGYMKTYAIAVTMDPDTASPWLILSEDGRSVRDLDIKQDLPYTPQRFTYYSIVLGRERLGSGRRYWEVEVELGDKTGWTLGVCDEAVNRKGKITLTPENGFWAVMLRDGEYEALTDPSTLLTPRAQPKVVGFFLDYEAGRLSVYNVDDQSLLFTFSGASFPPTLRPFFKPGLTKGGVNAGTLRILPVTGRK